MGKPQGPKIGKGVSEEEKREEPSHLVKMADFLGDRSTLAVISLLAAYSVALVVVAVALLVSLGISWSATFVVMAGTVLVVSFTVQCPTHTCSNTVLSGESLPC
jgi:hypothetical protein